MAISRSLMNRQLQANGGIMDVSPREKFGLGSSLKKFVRKIIPNEVAEIAVKAAPFVAPFNPAIAAAMGGLGTFDQTGSISDSLKRGALTYGLGQGARFLGGAGLQGNPFTEGGAFRGGFEGFKSGFSSPLGTETGFKLGKPVEGVQSVDQGLNTSDFFESPTYLEEEGLDITGGGSPRQLSITESIKKIVGPDSTLNERGTEALNLLKRGTKAAFTKPDGKGGTMIDKAAVIGAVTFATSYAEAKALANEAGVEITEEEYNEATKADKQAEYAGYLKNFFAGKKDGGRIGFARGTEETSLPVESLIKLIKGDIDEGRGAMDEEMQKTLNIEDAMAQSNDMRFLNELMNDLDGKYPKDEKDFYYKSIVPLLIRSGEMTYEDGMNLLEKLIPEMRAAGGRIGFDNGGETAPSGIFTLTDYVNFLNAAEDFNKAYDEGEDVVAEAGELVKSIGDKEYDDMSFLEKYEEKKIEDKLENLEKLFMKTEDDYYDRTRDLPEDEEAMGAYARDLIRDLNRRDRKLQALAEIAGLKDGGRIGLRKGTDPEEAEIGIMTIDVEAGDDDDIDDLMAGGITFNKAERAYLYKRLGGSYMPGKSSAMPKLYYILNFPDKYPEDAAVLKEIAIMGTGKKDGGRIKYSSGANRVSELLLLRDEKIAKGEDVTDIEAEIFQLTGKEFKSVGGISNVPTGKIRKNSAGIKERDYRDEGGFVPVGIKEKADDVPAMLSKNEFVMTADAVRGIGGGDVEKGSKKLYNLMKNAEQVGKA